MSLAEQAVDSINGVFGRHAGFRAAHAKGITCRGTFTAAADAASLTRAPHMQGDPVDVTVRFSNASGHPLAPDASGARGMAVKFHLDDGKRTDIVAITLPCFFVNDPKNFIRFNRAIECDRGTHLTKIRPGRLLLFAIAHPIAAWKARTAAGAARRLGPVPSFANCRFNGIHAFKWTGVDGRSRFVRYSWIPAAGEPGMSRDDARGRDADFLEREIAERLAQAPVRFALELQIAGERDRTDDATVVWPADRETVAAGTLELTAIDPSAEALVFDPTFLVDGIEPSGDPILNFRRHAYKVSAERRGAA